MKNMRIPEYVSRVPEASHVARTVKWAKQHAAQIAQYNAWAMKREPTRNVYVTGAAKTFEAVALPAQRAICGAPHVPLN